MVLATVVSHMRRQEGTVISRGDSFADRYIDLKYIL
jgi:hypothetical protein